MSECVYCSSTFSMVREKFFFRAKKELPELQFPICNRCFSTVKTKGVFQLGRTTRNVTKEELTRVSMILELDASEKHGEQISDFLNCAFHESKRLELRIQEKLDEVAAMHARLNEVNTWHLNTQQRWGYALLSRYQRRRTEANQAIGKQALRALIFARDKFRCVICDSDKILSVDHIIPVRKGGSDEPENLQTLCKSCNSKKGCA